MKVFQILLNKHEHFVVLSFLELNTKFIDTLQGRLLQNDKNLYAIHTHKCIPCTYTHAVAGGKNATGCHIMFKHHVLSYLQNVVFFLQNCREYFYFGGRRM